MKMVRVCLFALTVIAIVGWCDQSEAGFRRRRCCQPVCCQPVCCTQPPSCAVPDSQNPGGQSGSTGGSAAAHQLPQIANLPPDTPELIIPEALKKMS